MRIAILSRSRQCYSTRRLCEAAMQRGHRPRVLDTLAFGMLIEAEHPQLTFRGKPLRNYDAVIPRIGASVTSYGTAVVRQFEQIGAYVVNPSHGISASRDKLRAFQAFSRHDINIPATAYVRRKKDVLPAIERVGGAPVIIKLLEGTQGKGVILADTINVAAAIIETLTSTRHDVLIQKFVAESKGRDIRAFVVGDKVVAAMRRQAVGQEFRSNVHRGGSTQPILLDETYARSAVHAAQIMGLRVAGVDMLESAEGPQIMEVNSSPGLQGIESATGFDVAGAVIDYVVEHAKFRYVDIRHRLSVARGYMVAEFAVTTDSELASRTLAETQLRERGIVVLNVRRNGLVIPAPTGSREILPGDVLLCYGNQNVLRSLVGNVDDRGEKPQSRILPEKRRDPVSPPHIRTSVGLNIRPEFAETRLGDRPRGPQA